MSRSYRACGRSICMISALFSHLPDHRRLMSDTTAKQLLPAFAHDIIVSHENRDLPLFTVIFQNDFKSRKRISVHLDNVIYAVVHPACNRRPRKIVDVPQS